MSLYSLEQLFFAYPQDPDILQEVSLSFFPEEKIGFYGPNGCGKSTLFRLIMGLLQPKRGHICFQGKSLKTEKEFRTLRREVGLVLQNADDQLFHPTVLEDIAFGPLNLGLKAAAARERAMDTLKQLGLSHLYTSLTHLASRVVKNGLLPLPLCCPCSPRLSYLTSQPMIWTPPTGPGSSAFFRIFLREKLLFRMILISYNKPAQAL